MTIHGETTPKDQARVLKEVISHIEEDFIDINSFSDVQIHKQDPPFEKEWNCKKNFNTVFFLYVSIYK